MYAYPLVPFQSQVKKYLNNSQPDRALRALLQLPKADEETANIVETRTNREVHNLLKCKRTASTETLQELLEFSVLQEAAHLETSCPLLYRALEGIIVTFVFCVYFCL